MQQYTDMLAVGLRKPVDQLQLRVLHFEVVTSLQQPQLAVISCGALQGQSYGVGATLHHHHSDKWRYISSSKAAKFLTGSWSADVADVQARFGKQVQTMFSNQISTLWLPSDFAHGSCMSSILDTGAPLLAVLYADGKLLTVVPVYGGRVCENLAGRAQDGYCTSFVHFREAYDTLLYAAASAASKLCEGSHKQQLAAPPQQPVVVPLPLHLPVSRYAGARSRNEIKGLDTALQAARISVILQLTAVPLDSSTQPTYDSLQSQDMGLDKYVERVQAQPADLQLVPVNIDLILCSSTADLEPPEYSSTADLEPPEYSSTADLEPPEYHKVNIIQELEMLQGWQQQQEQEQQQEQQSAMVMGQQGQSQGDSVTYCPECGTADVKKTEGGFWLCTASCCANAWWLG
jgi:hypothetical protein